MNFAAIIFLTASALQAAPCTLPDTTPVISKSIASGSAIRFCLRQADAPQKCFRFEKGIFQKDNGQFENGAVYSRARIQIQGKTVKACREKCGTFTVPQISRTSRADVNEEGTVLLLEKGSKDSKIQFQAFDQKGPAGSFEIPVQDRESSDWFIAQGILYVRDCVGAGPGCTGRGYDLRTGKELFMVGQDKEDDSASNLYAGVELPFRGSVWAFLTAGGAEIIFQDVKSGRVVRRVRAKSEESTDPERGSRLFFIQGRMIVLHADGQVLEFDPADGSQKSSVSCNVK